MRELTMDEWRFVSGGDQTAASTDQDIEDVAGGFIGLAGIIIGLAALPEVAGATAVYVTGAAILGGSGSGALVGLGIGNAINHFL